MLVRPPEGVVSEVVSVVQSFRAWLLRLSSRLLVRMHARRVWGLCHVSYKCSNGAHKPFLSETNLSMKTKVIALFHLGTFQKCFLDSMASLKKDGFLLMKENRASPTTSRHKPTSCRFLRTLCPFGCDSMKTFTSSVTSEKVVADE